MEEMMMFRMLGAGSLFGGIDWVAVLAFLVIAVVYWLTPILGCRFHRPGNVAASLYLLIGYAGVSLLQFIVQFFQLLERSGRGMGGGEGSLHLFFGFSFLKTLLFVIALIMFVIGLQSLRIRRPEIDEERRDVAM